MVDGKSNHAAAVHDAAVAAAMIVMEEFFPHCPNGIGQAIEARLVEIIEAAIGSADSVRWSSQLQSFFNRH